MQFCHAQILTVDLATVQHVLDHDAVENIPDLWPGRIQVAVLDDLIILRLLFRVQYNAYQFIQSVHSIQMNHTAGIEFFAMTFHVIIIHFALKSDVVFREIELT
jgi:hypothetical protein